MRSRKGLGIETRVLKNPGYPGNPDILPKPETRVWASAKPAGFDLFRVCVFALKALHFNGVLYHIRTVNTFLTSYPYSKAYYHLQLLSSRACERRKHSSSNASSARRERTYRVLLLLRIHYNVHVIAILASLL